MSRRDIEAREKAWLKAFNGGDASGVAALYAEGARLMPPNSEIVEGRAAIEGFVKEFVQTGAQLSFNLLTVHESPSMCASVGRYTMDIPGAPQDQGKFIEVWTRQGDGTWQIADDIFNSNNPPAPA
jgi:ketosteroid isomerase-like protein